MLAVKDEEGNPIYPAGVSIAFDHMLDKCIAIVVPKSGLSAEVDWVGNITYSRTRKVNINKLNNFSIL
jgi:hypothetical protein